MRALISTSAVMAIFVCLASPARAEEPLARIIGLPEEPAFESARAAVGAVDAAPDSLFAARRNARLAAERLDAALRAEGYYGARIEPSLETTDPPTAIVTVEPGPRFIIGAIEIVLPGEIAEDVAAAARAAAALETGAPARAEDVIAARSRVAVALRGAGYPDARADEPVILVDHDRGAMDVTLAFSTGPRVSLGDIRATGGARVRQSLLERLAPFATGEIYAPAHLTSYAQRLRDTGAFSSVAVTLADDPTAQMRPVLVALEDEPRRTLTLGASYSTSEGGGGEVAWILRNAFAGAEQLTIEARLLTIERSLTAEIAIPAWRRPRRTLRLSTGAIQEETDAFDRSALTIDAEAEQPVFPRISAAIGVGLTVQETTDAQGSQRFILARGAASANYDQTNDTLDPTRGARLRLTLRPVIGGGDEAVAYLVTDIEGRAYQPLGSDRFVAAGRLRLGAITASSIDNTPPDDLFFAGGGGSVRGFEYQAISPRDVNGVLVGGRSLVETSLELRARLTERFGGVVFVDAGAASRQSAPSFDEVRWGAGLGVRYYTAFGPLRVDLATPLDPFDGDARVQLYFSIGQAF